MTAALVALALGVAVMLWPVPVLRAVRGRDGAPRRRPAGLRPALFGVAGVLAIGVLLGLPWFGVVPVALAVGTGLLRRTPGRSAAVRRADRRLLAEHADLFSACLESGASPVRALSAATDAVLDRVADRPAGVGSPVDRLRSVAALLVLGAPPATAWAAVADDEDLAGLAAAALRSGVGGAALAGAVREHAVALRRELSRELEDGAGRAAVAITAPLAVCFLPAFLCLGLAPVVLALLRSLGIG